MFPCASRSPYSDECLHHSLFGTCVSDRINRFGQSHCSQRVLCTLKVEWHHFFPAKFPSRSRVENFANYCFTKGFLIVRINLCWLSAKFLWVLSIFEYKLSCWIGSTSDIIVRSLLYHDKVFGSKDRRNTVIRIIPYVGIGIQWSCLTA